MNAKNAQRRLSNGLGVVQPRGWRRVVPAERTRERPAPTWIPLTTGVGMTCVNHRKRPLILNRRTMEEVVKPAEMVSSIVNLRAIATAAIAFMGCTGSGMPKATPVKMFQSPEKTSVVESDIELLIAKAIMSGRSVPKSPNDPEISDKGELRRTAILLA